MPQNNQHARPVVDWLTAVALAAMAISLTIAFHEGVHALTCVAFGGDLQEYSALHVSCELNIPWQEKVKAGSASVANLILGFIFLVLLRRSHQQSTERQFFFWLFMLTNWLNGAGYWMLSGVGNFGDWANVIAGWQPLWLWRLVMALGGTGVYAFLVWLALRELGKIIGGDANEQIGRAVRLGLIGYGSAVLVILLAGLFNPYGMASSPVVGGTMAVVFGLSPLLWMMQWFRAASFAKPPRPALEIHRKWGWVVTGGVVVLLYIFVLGPTLYF
ncbi:MAG TPA: hypothetical protein PL105_15380 [Caldilineaceae bacterium]|nr:hypothetical protein [Caldilineaceae bacterium]